MVKLTIYPKSNKILLVIGQPNLQQHQRICNITYKPSIDLAFLNKLAQADRFILAQIKTLCPIFLCTLQYLMSAEIHTNICIINHSTKIILYLNLTVAIRTYPGSSRNIHQCIKNINGSLEIVHFLLIIRRRHTRNNLLFFILISSFAAGK